MFYIFRLLTIVRKRSFSRVNKKFNFLFHITEIQSSFARELIHKMLESDFKKRITSLEVVQHLQSIKIEVKILSPGKQNFLVFNLQNFHLVIETYRIEISKVNESLSIKKGRPQFFFIQQNTTRPSNLFETIQLLLKHLLYT